MKDKFSASAEDLALVFKTFSDEVTSALQDTFATLPDAYAGKTPEQITLINAHAVSVILSRAKHSQDLLCAGLVVGDDKLSGGKN